MLRGIEDGDFIPQQDFYIKSFLDGTPYHIPKSEIVENRGIKAEILGDPTLEVYVVMTGIGFTMNDRSDHNIYGLGAMIELHYFHSNQVIVVDPPEEIERTPVSFLDQVDRTIQILDKILTDDTLTNPEQLRMIGYSQGGHLISAILDRVSDESPLRKFLSSIYIISPAAVSMEGNVLLQNTLNKVGKKKEDGSIVINGLHYGAQYIEEVTRINITDTLSRLSQQGVKITLFPEFPEQGALISREDLKTLQLMTLENYPVFFVSNPPQGRKHIPGHRDGSITLLQALGIKPEQVGEHEGAWKNF